MAVQSFEFDRDGARHAQGVSRGARPEGDVFVLYSCKGYHADDQMQQRWLQLRDDQGVQWLTNQIDMFETRLTPDGEGLKAQIFFSPPGGPSTKLARLSIRLNEWEYLSVEEPSTRFDQAGEPG